MEPTYDRMPARDQESVEAAEELARATGKPPKIPSFLTSGGGANSCYMWREDGPLVQIRFRSSE